MAETVELEIGLRRHGDQHAVELRCSSPDSQTEVRSGSSLV